MNEMTLHSRHRIQNSSPGGLRPSTLPLGHGGSPQYVESHEEGGTWNKLFFECCPQNLELFAKSLGTIIFAFYILLPN